MKENLGCINIKFGKDPENMEDRILNSNQYKCSLSDYGFLVIEIYEALPRNDSSITFEVKA